ncbi:formylglycine-generating enzyme family protein [Nocardia carnea]|uniref:Formylglycine-generating enzyme family protein n=1 Tax=Nocardia carnea TaxID=37328 RepID=A0ABW7U0W7_9NOCA|nr:formylglycine-generating enzyme family protein [Nocardia carnea]
MVWIPGGTYWMGSDDHYAEERPAHQVSVDGFWMDSHPVTVAQFRRFVKATGYRTTAELEPDPAEFPDADPDLLAPGSMVFTPPPGPVPLNDYRRWWRYVPGADWRHPEGPGSNVGERNLHPVTQVSYLDACAYAAWAGKSLPTEAEWEFAARGGLHRATYVWGEEREPGGRPGGNVWQGKFPWENLELDGYAGTSPVGKFRANGFGLHDMAGNVWEWTFDHLTPSHADSDKNVAPARSCCIPRNPVQEVAVAAGAEPYPRRVVKGGSHLCSPNYCDRYRPAARQGHTEDASTGHIGFRCIVRIGDER